MLRNNLAYTSISIHAPRTGSDRAGKQSRLPCWYFNPRSPHGERQSVTHAEPITHAISIHAPRTGSDIPVEFTAHQDGLISIHAPRTGSDKPTKAIDLFVFGISIHAPRTGSDAMTDEIYLIWKLFQSTLPARGATRIARYCCAKLKISIHAPRTGSDAASTSPSACIGNFNPRSPHGERPFTPTTTGPLL